MPKSHCTNPSLLVGGADKIVSFKDRKEKLIAEMLTRFRNLVSLATIKGKEGIGGATREVAAAEAFAMEVESAALVKATQDLLSLTRELKEMWLFGPLRGIGEGEGEGQMDEDSRVVGEMVEKILRRDVESDNSKLSS